MVRPTSRTSLSRSIPTGQGLTRNHYPSNGCFRTFPPLHEVDYHVAPRRQWVIIVSGIIEVDCAGGCRRFGPGDILFMDDLEGKGHITRNIQGTWVLAYLPVPQDFRLSLAGQGPDGTRLAV